MLGAGGNGLGAVKGFPAHGSLVGPCVGSDKAKTISSSSVEAWNAVPIISSAVKKVQSVGP